MARIRLSGNWMPLLTLLLLAGFSWWVAQQALRAVRAPSAVSEAQVQPDYFLQGFQVRSYALDGRQVSVVSGTAMQHIPADQTLHISDVVLHSVSADKVAIDASARRAISNADGSNVQLLGQAELQRNAPGQPALTVRGDFLNLFPPQQKLTTDRPSTVERDGSIMGAQQLEVDALTGQVTLHGRVSVVLPPKSRP